MVALKNSIDKTHQSRAAAVSSRVRSARRMPRTATSSPRSRTKTRCTRRSNVQKRETMHINASAAGFSDLTER